MVAFGKITVTVLGHKDHWSFFPLKVFAVIASINILPCKTFIGFIMTLNTLSIYNDKVIFTKTINTTITVGYD